METVTNVSEYEAKRLLRIEENRKKLLSLDLPTLPTLSPIKTHSQKRKWDADEKPPEPSRKSLRQHQTRLLKSEQRKLENKPFQPQFQLFPKELQQCNPSQDMLEKHQLKRHKELLNESFCRSKRELKEKTYWEEEAVIRATQPQSEQHLKVSDWKLRRKREAQLERRQSLLNVREDQKAQRIQDTAERIKQRVIAQEQKRRTKEQQRLEKFVLKELEKEQRYEEHQCMRQEDALARQWAKEHTKAARKQRRIEKKVANQTKRLMRIVAKNLQAETTRDKEVYSIRKIHIPFVSISIATAKYKHKLPSDLKVDTHVFHDFALGKQFLPPGKMAVIQSLCPGGYTASICQDVNIYVWKNALTLFINGANAMYYHHFFQETTHCGRNYVFFRYLRCEDFTPLILERLCRVEKGKEWLRFATNYYDIPESRNLEPLLLFIQYPKGPYIYCGRLGYLGYRSKPLEFSFQLLDTDAFKWKQIFTLLTTC
ncbi:hypothetical protein CCR75_007836 [Bremia lactucae]|uniref:Uncharacterized protein n=1 Tax=Bremia lactucae TaxID=4779 RepID=A0A976FGY2_BRELC|nr:hypothetical protein CCR75_007836 [Bremia lactucae]